MFTRVYGWKVFLFVRVSFVISIADNCFWHSKSNVCHEKLSDCSLTAGCYSYTIKYSALTAACLHALSKQFFAFVYALTSLVFFFFSNLILVISRCVVCSLVSFSLTQREREKKK